MSGRRLRVMVVHNRHRPAQPSGEDQVVDQEVDLLTGAGHHVSMFERRSDDIVSMSLPRKAVVPLQVPWNAAARADLTARLHAERPDVVHIHNTFPLLSPSVLDACADVGIPAVATLHNYLQVCPSGTLYRAGRVCTDCTNRLPLASLRHGCYRDSRLATVPLTVGMLANRRRWWSGVTRFFCISHAQRKILIQAGMPAQRLAVKHNFVVDPGVHRSGAGEHVLYLGRINEGKGLRVLMAAWGLLAASGGAGGLPLVLAGSGPLEDELTHWARDRDDVAFLGLRSKVECAELTARAAAVVLPTIGMEPFGLVVVEAMAAGVPVVAAAQGALVEIVQDQVTGLLHRPGDAVSLAQCVRQVLSDADRNRELGAAARRCYQARFTPKMGLAALVDGYEAAIAGHLCESV